MVVVAYNDQNLRQIWKLQSFILAFQRTQWTDWPDLCFGEAQCAASTSHNWTAHKYEELSTKCIPHNCHLLQRQSRGYKNVQRRAQNCPL